MGNVIFSKTSAYKDAVSYLKDGILLDDEYRGKSLNDFDIKIYPLLNF